MCAHVDGGGTENDSNQLQMKPLNINIADETEKCGIAKSGLLAKC